MQENVPQIIKTIGEEGEEIFMKLQEIVTLEGQDYALLAIAKDENDTTPVSDDEELIIMKMFKTDADCTFEIIETDEEFNAVVEAISDDSEEE